jgi:hypothetical protein
MRAEQAQHAEEAAVPVQAPPAPAPEPMAAPEPVTVAPRVQEERPAVREERAAPPPRQRVEEPRIDPKEILESAGLVMIETDRSKVRIQAPVMEEPQPAGRPRRERPKPPPQDGELEQVETRK